MNIEKRFLEICTFLKQHKQLMQTEVLELYPFNGEFNYKAWAKDFHKLSKEEIIFLENHNICDKLNDSDYQDFLQTINNLLKVPEIKTVKKSTIPNSLKRKLTLKKQHEMISIMDIIDSINPKQLIDIGSGAGHLSSLLVHDKQRTSLCIDMNKDYQNIGVEKLKKYSPSTLEKVTFKQLTINQESLQILETKNACLLGLHTCGDLSVILVKNFQRPQFSTLLNIGCCYHKLTKENTNISKISKDFGVELSYQALTMASKSYKKLGLKEFKQRQNVKSFRYTIHLLMQEELEISFKTLGNANEEDYLGSFLSYVRKYLPEAKNLDDNMIEKFYIDKKEKVKEIMNIGIIRSQLARVVELYLILDRSLYLLEKGLKTEVIEIFDREISPRNFAIISHGA